MLTCLRGVWCEKRKLDWLGLNNRWQRIYLIGNTTNYSTCGGVMNIITDNSKVNYNLVQESEALKAENEKLNEFIVYLKKEADILTNRLLIAGLGLEDIRLGVAENSDWYRAEAERTFAAMAEK